MPRIYTPQPLHSGHELALDAAAARHVQVLRKQPGDRLTVFNGQGGEYEAEVVHMGRSEVRVRVGHHDLVERELGCAVHIAVGVPANERMEWLVEKATELGVASIQPLMLERSVLRLAGERAEKKVAHWQAVAAAACEQSGRNRVPTVHPVRSLAQWLAQSLVHIANGAQPSLGLATGDAGSATLAETAPVHAAPAVATASMASAAPPARYVLSLSSQAVALGQIMGQSHRPASLQLLSGPEGGLSPTEEQLAIAAGFAPLGLGARVLRAETAPLAVLASVAVWTS